MICSSDSTDVSFVCFSYRTHRKHSFQRPETIPADGKLNSSLSDLQHTEGIRECAILSTCIRTEFYVVTAHSGNSFIPFHRYFSTRHGIPPAEVESNFFSFKNSEAIRHLFAVVAGLDSTIIGEKQIVHQVKTAYRAARLRGTTGKVLNVIFQKSLNVSKRIRGETDIDKGVFSSGSLAVKKLTALFPALNTMNALIIGSGQMGKIMGRNLKKAGCTRITFCSRNMEAARSLAEDLDATCIPFSSVLDGIRETDILLSATAAPHRILRYHELFNVMKNKYPRRLCIMDIARPPDIDPRVASLPGVCYFSLFDVDHTAHDEIPGKTVEARKAWAIVDSEERALWPRIQRILTHQRIAA